VAHHLHVDQHWGAGGEGGHAGFTRGFVDDHGGDVLEVGAGVDDAGDHGGAQWPERRQVDPPGQDPVALGLDGVDDAHPASSLMAPAGQTSTHAMHVVHRSTSTSGRRGAASRARSGQVTRQAPQPVHRRSMATVMGGTPGA
jgi:hypothetical protein